MTATNRAAPSVFAMRGSLWMRRPMMFTLLLLSMCTVQYAASTRCSPLTTACGQQTFTPFHGLIAFAVCMATKRSTMPLKEALPGMHRQPSRGSAGIQTALGKSEDHTSSCIMA